MLQNTFHTTRNLNLYFISGLGADRRAFDKIKLDPAFQIHHIDWIEPLPNESLQGYARRMAKDIDTNSPFALVGLSFGGIVCIEIAKFLNPLQIIQISSVSNRSELPWYFRLSGKLNLHQLGFAQSIKKSDRLLFWFFGTKSNKLKAYLKEMIDQTSTTYLRWSMNAISNWQQLEKPQHVIHIHGTVDKLFPIKYCKADIVIEKGSHFMVVTHGKRISDEINTILTKLTYHL